MYDIIALPGQPDFILRKSWMALIPKNFNHFGSPTKMVMGNPQSMFGMIMFMKSLGPASPSSSALVATPPCRSTPFVHQPITLGSRRTSKANV